MNTCEQFYFAPMREPGRCYIHFKGNKQTCILSKEIELQMEANLIFFCREEGSPSKLDSDRVFMSLSHPQFRELQNSSKATKARRLTFWRDVLYSRQCRGFPLKYVCLYPWETGSVGLVLDSEICFWNRSPKLWSSRKASCNTSRTSVRKSIVCTRLFFPECPFLLGTPLP